MRKAARERVVSIGALVVSGLGLLFAWKWSRRDEPAGVTAEQVADVPRQFGAPLPSLWPAPAFAYLDQNGRPFTSRDLRGRVWVSDFFFTSCTSICPTMTAAMSRLQREITNRAVQFVSFSIDPDHDAPSVLKAYARMWGADESRWHFLSTDKEKVAVTAAGMRTFVRPLDKDSPIQHSAVFILTDSKGQVRGVYDSSDALALRRLEIDALALAGTPSAASVVAEAAWPVPRSDAAQGPGAALYVRCGCLACHAQGRVAPPLDGRFGRAVRLADGRTVIFDDAYLRESILDPNAKVVAGYPALMPSYRGQLTEKDVDDVVAYVRSLRAVGSGPSIARVADAIDPVCGMTVASTPERPNVEYRGRKFYFCSESCRARFLRDPRRFSAETAGSAAIGADPRHGSRRERASS